MKIKINRKDWEIIQVPANDKRLEQTEDEVVCGITNYSNATIYISREIAESTMKDTIVHELAHAFIDVYGHPQYKKYSEENVCDLFGAFALELTSLAIDIFNEWNLE